MILPADTAWSEAEGVAGRVMRPAAAHVSDHAVDRIATLVMRERKTAILLRGEALQERGLKAAGKIAAHTGARLMCDTFTPRLRRGAGCVSVERLPYFSEQVVEVLAGTELIILVGAKPPVSFFGYPDKASWLTPQGCRLAVLAQPHEDGVGALEALSEACGAANARPVVADRQTPNYAMTGPLSAEFIMGVVAKYLPVMRSSPTRRHPRAFPITG